MDVDSSSPTLQHQYAILNLLLLSLQGTLGPAPLSIKMLLDANSWSCLQPHLHAGSLDTQGKITKNTTTDIFVVFSFFEIHNMFYWIKKFPKNEIRRLKTKQQKIN